ncbi:hypothetical protein BGZ99_004475 [Dissophora globulifera]|uniref:ELYS-like domain-containing protein n=1 Tax=Dissophora globulifera TaxID=979702 RepID=A0A9P6V077_9FUNG|nr:hypothetical protein BGZ99_004475 [Dissophora globulifera]
MTLVTEFRPVSHEFLPDDFHGAAFVGAKSADAMWFYRFDSSFIEVRDIFTCQDRVFASLSTSEITQRFKELFKGHKIRIVKVQDAYVGEFHTLVFVVREANEDRDHVFIWNLLTLHLQLLVSSPRPLTAATVTAQQAITRSNANTNSSSAGAGAHGDTTASSIDLDEDEDEHEHQDEPQSRRKITAFATLSNKSAGSIPVIVAGTSEAKVFVIKYDGAQESKKLQVLMALEDLKSKNLPITSITLEHTNDETLDLLAVGQGYAPGMKECSDCPTISIYYLRLQRSDYRLLGYVQPPMLEGEVATGGRTLAATVSEDANGLRIHCAFSIQVGEAALRSNLTTVQINNRDVQNLDVVEMMANEGGTLLDISSQSNSYELAVLYLGKIVNYVHAADIEWNRKEEAEGADGAEGQETLHRDLAPVYGSFFEEKGKFNYTDAELVEIEKRREQLGGKLFYDRLLEFVELEAGVLYPPRNHNQQRNLWTNIYFNGSLDTDNRNCLAYYLLKSQHADASEQFLKEYMIPPRFVDLMDGFWALDHFEFENAVLYLSRPGLTVDWIEDVIEAIFDHGSPHLALQFIVAANLDVASDRFVELKMRVLLATDFAQAFYFQREVASRKQTPNDATATTADGDAVMVTEPTKMGESLFESLLEYSFRDKPDRKAIQALSTMTMNAREESAFIRYCAQHSGLTREVGQEFLIMYYVNHSRYLEAIRMHRKLLAVELEHEDTEQFHREALERRNNQQFGEGAKQAGKKEMSKGQKRQMIIDNLMMVLPAAQRTVLELEDERAISNAAVKTKKGKKAAASSAPPPAGGVKSVVQSLMQQVDGPLTSLKGVDLDWTTRSMNRHAPESHHEDSDKDKDQDRDQEEHSHETFAPSQLLQNNGVLDAQGKSRVTRAGTTTTTVEELEQFPDNFSSGHTRSSGKGNGKGKDASKQRAQQRGKAHDVEGMDLDM